MMIPLLKLRPRPTNTADADATTVDLPSSSSYLPTSNIWIPLLSSSSSSSSSLRKKKETAAVIATTRATGVARTTGAVVSHLQIQKRAKKRVGDIDPAAISSRSFPMMSMLPPSRSTTSSSQLPPTPFLSQCHHRQTQTQQQLQKKQQQQQQQQDHDDATDNRHSSVAVAVAPVCIRKLDAYHHGDGRKRSRTMMMMMMIDPQQEQNNEEEEQRDKKKMMKKKQFDKRVLSPTSTPSHHDVNNNKRNNQNATILFTPPPPVAGAGAGTGGAGGGAFAEPMKTPSLAVSSTLTRRLESRTMLQVVTTSAHVDRKKKEMIQRPSFLKLPSSFLSVSSKSPSPSPPTSFSKVSSQLQATMMCTSDDEENDAIGECAYTHDNDNDDAVHRRSATTSSTTTKPLLPIKTMPQQAPLFLIRKKEGRGGAVIQRMKKQTARSLSLGNHHRSLSSVFLTPPIVLDETRFLMQEMVS